MPKEVDASTKNGVGVRGGGSDSLVGECVDERVECHHWRSDKRAVGGDFLIYGELRKFHDATKADRHGM